MPKRDDRATEEPVEHDVAWQRLMALWDALEGSVDIARYVHQLEAKLTELEARVAVMEREHNAMIASKGWQNLTEKQYHGEPVDTPDQMKGKKQHLWQR